jgi:hypothetical protein
MRGPDIWCVTDLTRSSNFCQLLDTFRRSAPRRISLLHRSLLLVSDTAGSEHALLAPRDTMAPLVPLPRTVIIDYYDSCKPPRPHGDR